MVKWGLTGVMLLLTFTMLAALAGYRWFNPPPPAAQLFYNGTILTMDPAHPQAQAMLVRRGEIQALGDIETLRRQVSRDVHDINLKGGVLMPGFIEAHGHFPGEGLAAIAVDASSPPIGDLKAIPTLLERLAALAQRRQEGWLIAYGFDDTRIGEQRYPTRQELDSVSQHQPILVMHISGHFGVINSAGLRLLNIDQTVDDPEGGYYGRDSQGRLNGLLAETAFHPVRKQALALGIGEGLQVMRLAADKALSRGITFAQNGLADANTLQTLRPALRLGLLPLRLSLWPDAEAQQAINAQNRAWPKGPRVHRGPVKLISDGSIQGYSAFLDAPYYRLPPSHPPDFLGFPTQSASRLTASTRRFHCQGRQVAIHANGNAAITLSLEAIAAARRACPRVTTQPVLIHAQMATDAQLKRMVQLDVIPSFFNVHVYYWGDRHRDRFLGPERAARISPLAQAEQQGLRFTLHADSPVVPFQPLQLVWNAVHRRTASGALLGPAQQIGVTRALQAVTVDAARQLGVDDIVGQLKPGMQADLVWLNRDPRQVLPRQQAQWQDIEVRGTWVGGVQRYPAMTLP